ncbi:redox-regulated ATPase YchF [Candidatus Roizmanbacteria bacterium RIFOXYB2_FULL_41_10]|uniref:Ribosome-binding ATPase YchF n=1 Tax=Candidatus Roizmanbacteria bacterium RIFOXYA1_FULL_41_12 TaxID=1802082 RepID=A0A1F7KAJ2_9BACT|nr:MAG: redox-regulated ATPase YchF [Candidatus Roizmanbacteria bacterium RIFOXYA1_FULL_41_12]OGK66860.1 MAG: redox-regulated ATPase YchF [Candidatus Roizmanbacteria bacterium RIFOXYB1_FULL_41_27]OGK67265.1 MAG: redox-regulated ATPase YchF [Candidatus Roizmanbacteria bacterium RIFOXYA2_FULL_41_8]OGK70766.1 MAG: redox-regulated ATPase YchF [Candidatus Roizmanbacteria bacterium RIFOXYC1_FULL_41_16]OGK71442.1 MAG: redox-regulated ATPase YchF [Candidatus Roizmanbacteria bacterium RIFOXYB2_FULL_41_1
MNLRIGIVGLPNAGKSTLFNALLKKQAALAANYPFATIDPNIGIVQVPDERLKVLAEIVKTNKIVPATVEFVDIAGLVRGAHSGEGLGNKFLSHIRETSAICYVLRFFKDPEVIHVSDRVDPKEDLAILNEELILADLQTLENQKEPKKNAGKEDQLRWQLVNTLKRHLNNNQPAREIKLDEEELELIKSLNLLTLKPAIYVANLDEDQLSQSREVLADFSLKPVIALSAKIESELIDVKETERREFLQSVGIDEPVLNKLAKISYDTLGLMSFLTAGTLEARAWTIPKNTPAVTAAGVIHTDFSQKFIKAEIVTFADFVNSGGWTNSRLQGKVRQEGRDYLMQEGDVVEFKIGA